MTTHHQHLDHVQPSPTIPPSLMRLSLGGRLLAVSILVLLAWVLVFWAIT
jgi:hypothetical protein